MNTLAHVALLTALGLIPHAQASELGRLFFTPAERGHLESAHKVLQAENGSSEQSVITVNGVIQRSDGSRIVWLNGRARKIAPGSDISKVPVMVPGKNTAVEVRVGQSVEAGSSTTAKFSDDKSR